MIENLNVCGIFGLAAIIAIGCLILRAMLSPIVRLFEPRPLQTGNRYFKSAIPKGMRLYTTTRVVGTSYRLEDVLAWSTTKKQHLQLSGDPNNKHDKNAIMVIGSCRTRKGEQHVQLGFVERELAERIASMRVKGVIDLRARLKCIWIGDNADQASIEFDLLGPKEHYKDFMGQ